MSYRDHPAGVVGGDSGGGAAAADREHHEDAAACVLHQEQVQPRGGLHLQGLLGLHSN